MTPPTTVHVSYCSKTAAPIIAEWTAAKAGRTSCPLCPQGECRVLVARYQHAPPKKRNGKKPRKEWR